MSTSHLFTHVSSSEIRTRSKYIRADKNKNNKMKNITYLHGYKSNTNKDNSYLADHQIYMYKVQSLSI